MNLTSNLPERRTWQEVHQEWQEGGGDRSRGKILLLYSPDTKLFKELQERFYELKTNFYKSKIREGVIKEE